MNNQTLAPKSLKRLHSLYVASFLFSISQALVVYAISSYLSQYVGEERVGLFFTVAFAIALIGLNILPKLLCRNGVLLMALVIIACYLGALLTMGFAKASLVAIIGFILYNVSRVLFNTVINIFVEKNSIDTLTGGIRGALFTLSDLGWLVIVFVMGFLLENYGHNIIFLISGLVMAIVLIILISNFKLHEPHPQHDRYNIKNVFKRVFKNRNLSAIFAIDTITSVFYSIMVIYTPIYLNQHIGFSWTTIGIIFTVMLLPFIIFQYPAGKLADGYLGEKEIMITGLVIMSFSTIALTFVNQPVVWIWMVLLFLTRTGASLVAVMSSSYFFKHVDGSDEELINFMQNPFPIAYIIGPLLASLMLFFYPIQFIFLFMGLIILLGLFFAMRLKDTR